MGKRELGPLPAAAQKHSHLPPTSASQVAYRAETGCPLGPGSMLPAEQRKRLSAGESRWRNVRGQRDLVREKGQSWVAIMSASALMGSFPAH